MLRKQFFYIIFKNYILFFELILNTINIILDIFHLKYIFIKSIFIEKILLIDVYHY